LYVLLDYGEFGNRRRQRPASCGDRRNSGGYAERQKERKDFLRLRVRRLSHERKLSSKKIAERKNAGGGCPCGSLLFFPADRAGEYECRRNKMKFPEGPRAFLPGALRVSRRGCARGAEPDRIENAGRHGCRDFYMIRRSGIPCACPREFRRPFFGSGVFSESRFPVCRAEDAGHNRIKEIGKAPEIPSGALCIFRYPHAEAKRISRAPRRRTGQNESKKQERLRRFPPEPFIFPNTACGGEKNLPCAALSISGPRIPCF